MAVNTTVEVTMPQMGDSVSEGTILEWQGKEGGQGREGQGLVGISTDKGDARVPSPAPVAKPHPAEGDTGRVGELLAEISQNGGAPAAADEPSTPAAADESPGGA